MEPTYRQAISHAWSLVWHHKMLWVFGAISLLLGQFGLNYFAGNVLFYSTTTFTSVVNGAHAVAWLLGTTETMQGFVDFIWLGCIALSFLALVAVASVSARGALIDAAAEWYKTKKFPSISRAWHKGAKHFWRLLALNIIERGLVTFILGFVLLLMSIYTLDESTTSFIIMVAAITVGTLLTLVISVVGIYAAGYVIVEEDDLAVSIARGWELFKEHLLVSLELSLVLMLLNVVLVVALSAASFLILIPSFFFSISGGLTGNLVLVAIAAVLYVALFIVVSALFGAIFNAFTTSAWIYLFMKMHHEGITSRIIHWARNFKQV